MGQLAGNQQGHTNDIFPMTFLQGIQKATLRFVKLCCLAKRLHNCSRLDNCSADPTVEAVLMGMDHQSPDSDKIGSSDMNQFRH